VVPSQPAFQTWSEKADAILKFIKTSGKSASPPNSPSCNYISKTLSATALAMYFCRRALRAGTSKSACRLVSSHTGATQRNVAHDKIRNEWSEVLRMI